MDLDFIKLGKPFKYQKDTNVYQVEGTKLFRKVGKNWIALGDVEYQHNGFELNFEIALSIFGGDFVSSHKAYIVAEFCKAVDV